MFRAVIVAAVSSGQQATEEKLSLPEQLSATEAVCTARGWDIIDRISISGHSRDYDWLDEITAECPPYALMVRMIRSGVINLVVVRDLDRLWRTTALQSQVCALCAERAVQIYSLNQPREPMPPDKLGDGDDTNLIMHGMSGIMAQMENRLRVRRIKVGMKGRVERGLHCYGREVPYGYKRDPSGKLILPDEREASWVRWMFARYLGGMSIRQLANELTRMGAPTPATNRPVSAESLRHEGWYVQTVSQVLHNEAYCGAVKWGKFYNPQGVHEPLIDRPTWERTQTVMASRARYKHRSDTPHPLAGIMRCGFCGYAVVCVGGSKGGYLRYERCTTYMRTAGRECKSNYHKDSDVRAFVMESVQNALRDPTAFLEARRATRENDAPSDELATIEREIASQRNGLTRWDMVYERNGIDINRYLDHVKRLETSIANLETRAALLRPGVLNQRAAENALHEMHAYADALPSFDDSQLHEVYTALLRAVHLRRGEPIALEWW